MSALSIANSINQSMVKNMCMDQEKEMKNWIITNMSPKLLPYFEHVTRPWDRTDVLLSSIKDLNYKDIVLKPVINDLSNEIEYEPYFKLNTLAYMIGYGEARNLLKGNGALSNCKKYYLRDLKKIDILGENTPSYITIIPEHLDDKTDRNRNNYIYIDASTCEDLISSAMKQTKFRKKAKEFKDVLNISTKVSNAIISKLNHLVSEYRMQQLESDQKRLALYDRQKEALSNALTIAIDRIKDVHLTKKYYMYIFTTKSQEVHMKYKFGITDDLPKRLVSLQNGDQTDGGKYVHTTEVYNNRWSEKILHQILRDVGLHCDGEWFMTPGEEPSIKLLDTLATSINDTYDVAVEFPSLIRDRLREQLAIECLPTIQAIMPLVDEEPPIKEFIKEIADMVGNGNSVYKTYLLKKLRDLANSDKYKKHRNKLPVNFNDFTTSTNDDSSDNGIKTETNSSGRITTIKFLEIVTTNL